MDRKENTNEGGSSTDTVIARSSSEEEKQKPLARGTYRGEYITVGDSSSSLDTLTGGVATLSSGVNTDDRKKSKFGALRSSFRESGIFKIKKRRANETEVVSAEVEQDGKEISRQRSRQPEDKKQQTSAPTDAISATDLKKKKKKSHSLVRKLSLNKFRLSMEQETQHSPPEGGESNRSRSQESPLHVMISGKKEGYEKYVLEREKAKGELEKAKKLALEEPPEPDTVVQHRSQSLTIKSFASSVEQQRQQDTEQHQLREKQVSSHFDDQCSSTLPYALSKWPEYSGATKPADDTTGKDGSKVESESDSSLTSRSSPVEVRRKLSLLEEKRAIFQRQLLDSSDDTRSYDAIIAVTADCGGTSNIAGEPLERRKEEGKKKEQQFGPRAFDASSTSKGRLCDESARPSSFGGIEEDCTENCDRKNDNYASIYADMVGAADHLEKSSSNNISNVEIGEKREHLYKILVIGELGAGKTSIIKRYVHQFFSQHYRATIGVDFALKVLNWDPHTIIRLQLWDIAGQERFGNMTRVYYKEAVGAFIVFDVTRSATLDAVVKWKQDLDSKVQLPDGSPIPCVLLANKCDQNKEGIVNSPAKMDDYCKEKNFSGWFETSAKENINIEEAARFLVTKILQNDHCLKSDGSQDQDGERFVLNSSSRNSKKFCSC